MTVSGQGGARLRRKNAYLLVATLACVAVIGLTMAFDTSSLIAVVAIVIAGAAAILATAGWFNALDELAQRAHYVAWYWGGTLGMLALPALAVGALFMGESRGAMVAALLDVFGARRDIGAAFTVGLVAAVVPALLGYLVWWMVFWLRRR